jgi:hypothetical protein
MKKSISFITILASIPAVKMCYSPAPVSILMSRLAPEAVISVY